MPEINSVPPIIVRLTRGGIVESVHRVYICVADNHGEVVFSRGDPEFVTFLRSSAKPFQAVATILSGAAAAYNLTDRELALNSGSHSGEVIHTDIVHSLLGRAGLGEEALQCGVHPPFDEDAKAKLERAGLRPSEIHHNCSGKHAGMLISVVHNGESVKNYLDPNEPHQRRITAVIAESAGVPVESVVIGIDGCSAPVHGIPMRGGATAFARLVEPAGVSSELNAALGRIGNAMRANPEMVAASKGRICTELIRHGTPHKVTAKGGAEGYYGVGWHDAKSGRALGASIKAGDGGQRGRDAAVIAVLQHFGVLPATLPESLKPFAAGALKNWRGLEIGEMTVTL